LPDGDPEPIRLFVERFSYISGEYADPVMYQALRAKLVESDRRWKVPGRRLFYLAVPPTLYETIANALGTSGLAEPAIVPNPDAPILILEKPFGRDLDSAIQLNGALRRHFEESQIYRIDHYMGKETVQNILMFRFANAILSRSGTATSFSRCRSPRRDGWSRASRITTTNRGDADMFQNTCWDAGAGGDGGRWRLRRGDSRRAVKLLRCVHVALVPAWRRTSSAGSTVQVPRWSTVGGYRQEPASGRLSGNLRAAVDRQLAVEDVPFFLRTGAVAARDGIASLFGRCRIRCSPRSAWTVAAECAGAEDPAAEGIRMSFQAKRPGSKVCEHAVAGLHLSGSVRGRAPESYQRLLLDAMTGDPTLFLRQDDVEVAWSLVTPILQAWEGDASIPAEYPAGAESFPDADALIHSSGFGWRRLSEM
jgi:glucose-6-phosphate 1-dehydrogenase